MASWNTTEDTKLFLAIISSFGSAIKWDEVVPIMGNQYKKQQLMNRYNKIKIALKDDTIKSDDSTKKKNATKKRANEEEDIAQSIEPPDAPSQPAKRSKKKAGSGLKDSGKDVEHDVKIEEEMI